MIEFFKSWTLNIVTLVLFIVLLEILVPSGKMKKLINMTSGFILIIAVINPFIGLFGKGIDLKDFRISASSYLDRRELEENSKVMKENQGKQIVEVYRNKLAREIEDAAGGIKEVTSVKADVIINEDFNSSGFGEIKRVYLYIKPGEKTSGIKPVENVKKVEINRSESAVENNAKSSKDKELESLLETKISKLLDISKDNIVVNFS